MNILKIINKITVVVLLIFIFAVLDADVEVSLIEPSYQLGYDEDVTLSINVNGLVQAMRAFEINISYDTSYFSSEQSDLQEGDFLSSSGDRTQWYVTGGNGNYTVTCSILGVTSGSSGSGTLFTLFLTNLNNDITSGTEVTLSNVILKDLLNNDIPVDTIGNCQISAVVEVLIIEPSYQLEYDDDVTLSVNVIGLIQPMRAFEINISYDTSYFSSDQSDLQEGDFLSNSGDETQWYVTGSNGNYSVACTILGVSSGSLGSGNLFTLSLTNLNNETVIGTYVTLSNVILRDLLNNDITVETIGNCQISIDTSPSFAKITILLEGPYIPSYGGIMSHNLIDAGYIPTISPYNSEDIVSLPDVSSHFIVDWVNIQLRTSTNGPTVKSSNAFLLENGSIVDVNGASSFPFYHTTGVEYYIVVQHRNHLDIMTVTSYAFGDNDGEATEVVLTDLDNVYGTNGVKELETGIYGMWAGDADSDGRVLTSDQADWKAAFGVTLDGYSYEDLDLDGFIVAADQALWKSNFGIAPDSQVPEQNRSITSIKQIYQNNKLYLKRRK